MGTWRSKAKRKKNYIKAYQLLKNHMFVIWGPFWARYVDLSDIFSKRVIAGGSEPYLQFDSFTHVCLQFVQRRRPLRSLDDGLR